jgi:hypothetical protein
VRLGVSQPTVGDVVGLTLDPDGVGLGRGSDRRRRPLRLGGEPLDRRVRFGADLLAVGLGLGADVGVAGLDLVHPGLDLTVGAAAHLGGVLIGGVAGLVGPLARLTHHPGDVVLGLGPDVGRRLPGGRQDSGGLLTEQTGELFLVELGLVDDPGLGRLQTPLQVDVASLQLAELVGQREQVDPDLVLVEPAEAGAEGLAGELVGIEERRVGNVAGHRARSYGEQPSACGLPRSDLRSKPVRNVVLSRRIFREFPGQGHCRPVRRAPATRRRESPPG